jgi:hypothetical protein
MFGMKKDQKTSNFCIFYLQNYRILANTGPGALIFQMVRQGGRLLEGGRK